MSEITPIKKQEPSELMVSALEKLLEDAKEGTLQGMVGVAIFDDGTTDQFWYEPPKVYHTTVISDRIIGAMERCKHKLLKVRVDIDDDYEHPPEAG